MSWQIYITSVVCAFALVTASALAQTPDRGGKPSPPPNQGKSGQIQNERERALQPRDTTSASGPIPSCDSTQKLLCRDFRDKPCEPGAKECSCVCEDFLGR
jgi:hypothetical protein